MTVAVFGEALIDLVGDDDGGYRAHLGGSPYNFAIGLARQGVGVSFVAPFSDDAFGGRLLASLHRDGVATPIVRRSRLPTSLALVTVGADGVPSYRLYRHGVADTDGGFEEIAAHLPDEVELFHTGSLALTPDALPKTKAACTLLRTRGAVVSVDVNIRLEAAIDRKAYLDGVRSLLPLADIVKASDEDLAALGFDLDLKRSAAIAYAKMRGGLLVVTHGSAGATVHAELGTVTAPAYPVAVADTIGAGDAFHAAFAAHLLRGGLLQRPLERIGRNELAAALDFASAAAAINVSRAGCSPPARGEVDSFLQSRREQAPRPLLSRKALR